MLLSTQMSRFIKIGEAAKILGVTPQTLRRWEETEQLMPEKERREGRVIMMRTVCLECLLERLL